MQLFPSGAQIWFGNRQSVGEEQVGLQCPASAHPRPPAQGTGVEGPAMHMGIEAAQLPAPVIWPLLQVAPVPQVRPAGNVQLETGKPFEVWVIPEQTPPHSPAPQRFWGSGAPVAAASHVRA
jgi:hypothetical protein